VKYALQNQQMHILQNKGNLTALEFDQGFESCTRLPSVEELEKARENRIVDYAMLFKKEAPTRVKINKVKLSLLENKPVVLGLMTPRSFVSPKMRGAALWQPREGERGFFGHALVVIGFDDAKNAFEVMNSWGEEWGDKGFAWIEYEDFAAYAYYAFQMTIDESKKRKKTYTGTFSLRRFIALDQNEAPIFEDIKLKRNRKRHYQINRKEESIASGRVFQLLVAQVTGGMYLYAFGIEPDGKIKSYFPLQGEHPKITVPEVKLYIPESDGGLQFNKKGKEFIVLLYATQPIPNLKDRISNLSMLEGEQPLDKIYELFKNEMVALKETNFSKHKMQFDHSAEQGYITPLVLEINVK
ncbi:MAG: C1 family peptidase, partial [Bacteroidota bacterium]